MDDTLTPPQDPTQEAYQRARRAVVEPSMGDPTGVGANVPLFPAKGLYEDAQAKAQRQRTSTVGDKVQSMWRQDGIVDGFIASHVGQQMLPDPSWNPYHPEKWKALSEGIREDLLPAFYDTRSEAHANYVRDLLLQKQEDQQSLEDMTLVGDVGRFAFGAVMPDQLLAGMIGGRAAQAIRLSRIAAASRAAAGTGAFAAEAAAAKEVARQAATASSKSALAGGAAVGATANAMFEAARQGYNFENDSTGVLMAGLMGAALSVPFGLSNLRASKRLEAMATREHYALDTLRKHAAGEELSPHQSKALTEALEANKLAKEIEAGKLSPEEAQAKWDALDRTPEDAPDPVEAGAAYYLPEGLSESPFLPGSIGAAMIREIPKQWDHRSAFNGSVDADAPAGEKAVLRLDIYSVLNRSENPVVRELGFKLVKDPIQNDSFDAQGWTASEWRSHLRRVYAGEFFQTGREARREAQVARGVNLVSRIKDGFDTHFFELVTRLTRGDETVLAANKDIEGALKKAAGALRKAYDGIYAEAVHAGVKGSDMIQPNDFYVNRVWDHKKLRDMESKHGKSAVVKLVADAIKVPGKTGDLKLAAKFIKALKKIETGRGMQDVLLASHDMGTLRSTLKDTGLSPSEIDDVVDLMFEAKAKEGSDAGTAPNLKFRFDLDENHSIQTPAGDLRISDLLENDARVLLDRYATSMGGHAGLAKAGFSSLQDLDAKLQEARDWFASNGSKGDAFQREIRLLDDIKKHLIGQPMSTQDFSTLARAATAGRAFTRSVMLGQLGFAAAFEMKQAAGLFGMRAMVKHSPTLAGIFRGLRNGHSMDIKLARDISHMIGTGHEMAMSYARSVEIEDGTAGKILGGFENAANSASHAVDLLSGNAGLTSFTRSFAARMFAQKSLDFAVDGRTLTPAWRKRMVGWGVDDDALDGMLAKLKEHSEIGPANKIESIDYEAWARADLESYETFQLAMTRAARDAIQDQDLGETMTFMHSTLGKVFGELKSFFLVAHAKNMLKNAHYRDWTSLQIWLLGFLGESLGYATQTSANYIGQPEELEKRLQVDAIARAAGFRMAAAGVLPTMLEMGYAIGTGGDSLVQPGTTVNTDNRSLKPASLIMAGRLLRAPVTLGGLAFGSDATSTKEMKDLFGVLPGSRLMGISQGLNYLSNTLAD